MPKKRYLVLSLNDIETLYSEHIKSLTDQTFITLETVLDEVFNQINQKGLEKVERSLEDLSTIIIFNSEPNFINEPQLNAQIQELIDAMLPYLYVYTKYKENKKWFLHSVLSDAYVVQEVS